MNKAAGRWASKADKCLPISKVNLESAARWLTAALVETATSDRDEYLLQASAIIRRVRKRLDPEGKSWKQPDWPEFMSDEGLIWKALAHVAGADSGPGAWHLRHAEAALRTLYGRQRGDSR